VLRTLTRQNQQNCHAGKIEYETLQPGPTPEQKKLGG